MARLVSRLAPVSTIWLGLLAGCASNAITPPPPSSGSGSGTGSTSGTASGSGTGTGTGAASGSSGTGGASGTSTSGAASKMDAGVDAQAFCQVTAMGGGSLPFIVDTIYHPSGWMGDAPAYPAKPADLANGLPAAPATTARMSLLPTGYTTIGDACTMDMIGRSSASAQGGCWKVTFIPFAKTIQPGSTAGTTKIGGGPGYGWAGAFWQYKLNNWGNLGGGYPIPPNATAVSFWAYGKSGGERVRFFTGEGAGTPCSDYVATTSVDTVLPNPPAWKQFTIPITGLDYSVADVTPGQGVGGYYGGVLGAFGFGVGDQTLTPDGGSAPPNETDLDAGPVADPAVPGQTFPPFFDSTVVFYIDDIEFQISDAGM